MKRPPRRTPLRTRLKSPISCASESGFSQDFLQMYLLETQHQRLLRELETVDQRRAQITAQLDSIRSSQDEIRLTTDPNRQERRASRGNEPGQAATVSSQASPPQEARKVFKLGY